MPRYGTHSRSRRFNDWGQFHKGMSYALLDVGRRLTRRGEAQLTHLAQEFLLQADAMWPHTSVSKNGGVFGGDRLHPWYYGQLHDSIAVRIADRNRTISVAYMPPKASPDNPQHTETESHIIGAEKAREMAGDPWSGGKGSANYYFLPGVQIQLLIAVPYAEKVNHEEGKRGGLVGHSGFADALMDDLITKVDDWMRSGSLWKRRLIATVRK